MRGSVFSDSELLSLPKNARTGIGSVRNVLICREAPVTYREDVALEDA